MDEQTIRERAGAFCDALMAGDMDRAAGDLSDPLRANLGQLVAMLPMPLITAGVESIDRAGAGVVAVLLLIGESSETRLETRWKERDEGLVIVEVSHLTEEAAAAPDEAESSPEEESAASN